MQAGCSGVKDQRDVKSSAALEAYQIHSEQLEKFGSNIQWVVSITELACFFRTEGNCPVGECAYLKTERVTMSTSLNLTPNTQT